VTEPEITHGDSGDAVSEEQQWHWDGEQWQPGAGPEAPGEGAVQHLSRDGQWLWDGNGWQQVQR
jgi:hypothetical protein